MSDYVTISVRLQRKTLRKLRAIRNAYNSSTKKDEVSIEDVISILVQDALNKIGQENKGENK